MKNLRHILLISALVLAASLSSLWVFKISIENLAQSKTRDLIGRLHAQSVDFDEFAELLTTHVHKIFVAYKRDQSQPILMKLRPYLTHRFVPSPLRLRSGAIEMIYLEGLCDNAARALIFVFEQNGKRAQILNIITQTFAHSALQVELEDGREILLDPYLGTLPMVSGRILSAKSAQQQMRNGTSTEQIWKLLSRSADHDFYKDFGTAKFAYQGENINLEGHVRIRDNKPFQLGKLNGASDDVSSDASKARLTPHWHYIGNRYDRGWTRSLIFHQDTTVIIQLTERADSKFITSTRNPITSGARLVYHMRSGEKLKFIDANAGYDWFRLKSHQDVDFIRFEPSN